MNTLMKTTSLGVAGVAAAALIGWQAPALADHGSDDATSGSSVSHRHGGDDDGADHDANDDNGRHHGRGHDDCDGADDNGNDDNGNDDNGRHHGRGHDDGPNHDANDDHGGDR